MTIAEKYMTATLKYATVSEQKMNIAAKIARWKNVHDVLPVLQFMNKKSAQILEKIIRSAKANAKQKWFDTNELIVEKIEVWRWPKLKRIRFTSNAKVHWYVKHRSFVKVVVWVK